MGHDIFGNIHQRPTRIIRHPIDEDRRTTIDLRRLVIAEGSRGTPACSTCTAPLARGAHFCGICGVRVQRRGESLTGMTLDNRYEVGELLAQGGFASVYRVRCLASGKDLALKVLHAELRKRSARGGAVSSRG